MGKLISIFSKREDFFNPDKISDDFTQLLKIVSENAQKKKTPSDINIVINPKEFVLSEMSSFLVKNKMIDPDIFRCTLYVSGVVSCYFKNIPESYYASDYFLKGIEENNPESVRRGADFCFLLCTFFPERGNRRMMKTEDYLKMGKMMYFYFYDITRKTIGLSMGNNFVTMVEVAKEVIIQ
ncbi:MAG: hypothetical protein V3574_04835 [Candidatus Moraniibacteriota bacterium]